MKRSYRARPLVLFVAALLAAPLACGGDEVGAQSSGGSGGSGSGSSSGEGGGSAASVCGGACDLLWQCPGGAELRQCATMTACGYCVFGTASQSVLIEHACDACDQCESAFKTSDQACAASGSCVRNAPLDAECAQKGLPAKGYFCAASFVSIPAECKSTGSASGIAYCCP